MRNIISWNLNSIKAKYPFLQLLIQKHNPTALCLQETKLSPSKNFFLKNYKIFRHDCTAGGNAKGGVLIAASSIIHSEPIPLNTELQAVAAKIFLDTPVTVCSIYVHHTDALTPTMLTKLTHQLPPPFLLTGDFNAHNIIWGSNTNDQRGVAIETFLSNTDTVLLNTGESTHFHMYTGNTSAIDLTLCSPSLASQLKWSVSSSLYSSDHYPQRIELLLPATSSVRVNPKWRFQNADWNQYQQNIDLSSLRNLSSADEMSNIITTAILTAAKASIPTTSPFPIQKRNRVPWWNAECQKLIKEKHKLQNQCRRHPTDANLTQFKIARAKVRQAVIKSKRESWRKFVTTINSSTPPTLLWNNLRLINNKRTYEPIPALYNCNRELITAAQDIVEIFADYYYKVTKAENLDTPNIEPHTSTQNTNNTEAVNGTITVSEVKTAIKGLKNSSPGPDKIHAAMLKHLTHQHLQDITYYFNHIWKNHDFPTSWREAHILPIRKPDKEKTLPGSYRPISLTNTLCKTMEKIITKRLHADLSTNQTLDQYQCGFRPAHSTTDNLLFLHEEIQSGFLQNQHTTCVFIDIEKAFDRVQPETILQALIHMNYSGHILHLVRNFLSHRTFRVRLSQELSTVRKQEVGVPQGSVLSPLLFILAMNSLPEVIKYPVKHLLYADDLVLYYRHNDPIVANQQLQTSINNLSRWGRNKGLKISTTKTTVINFTRKHAPLHLQLSLGSEQLQQSDRVRFLGLLFDSKLQWTQHINELKIKSYNRLNFLKILNGSSWGADRKCLLQLYTAYVRSILDYGCVIYSSASTSTLQKLDAIQHQALRIATGALRSSPVKSLHAEANIFPLQQHRHTKILTYYRKVLVSSVHINAYRLNGTTRINSRKSYVTYAERSRQLLHKYEVPLTDLLLNPHKSFLTHFIRLHLQKEWTAGPPTLLKTIKPTLSSWKSSCWPNRRHEKILCRLRIGHTLLTHSYFYSNSTPPECEVCGIHLDTIHFLNYCTKHNSIRDQTYGGTPYPVYETLTDNHENVKLILKFLKQSKLIALI